MKASHLLSIFAANLALGVLLPVQSLMICAHGGTLENLGLLFAALSAAVCVAEIPSGLFADLYGRKLCFLLSCGMGVCSSLLFALADGFAAVLAGMILYGLAMAFSSGSIEALALEACIDSGRPSSSAVSLFAFCQCAGLTLGALLGGLLPAHENYNIQLYVKIIFLGIASFCAMCLPKESRSTAEKLCVSEQLKNTGNAITKNGVNRLLFCMAVTAVVQVLVESYWQPQAVELQGGMPQQMLGFISGGGYLFTAIGSVAGGMLLGHFAQKWQRTIYLALAVIFCLFVVGLSGCNGAVTFTFTYIILYGVVGALSVAEQTMLNSDVNNSMRASLLSTASFTVRMAAIGGSIAGSVFLPYTGIGCLWKISAVAAICILLGTGIYAKRAQRDN